MLEQGCVQVAKVSTKTFYCLHVHRDGMLVTISSIHDLPIDCSLLQYARQLVFRVLYSLFTQCRHVLCCSTTYPVFFTCIDLHGDPV